MPLTQVPDALLNAKGAAKAWVIFSGDTDSTGAASSANTNRQILASFNVDSVARTAAGTYVANLTSGALADANYCEVYGSVGQGMASRNATFTPTATQLGITTRSVGAPGTLADVSRCMVVIFD